MVETTPTAGFWPSVTEPFRTLSSRLADWFAPASEASREADAYAIRMELPGVKQADIDIALHDGTLVVKGEKRAERTESTEAWFFSECQYGSFQRSFRLPPDVDADKVAAEFADGILTIRAPRRAQASGGGRRIEIGG